MNMSLTTRLFLSSTLLIATVDTVRAQRIETKNKPDSSVLDCITASFEKLKADTVFQKEMEMEGEPWAYIDAIYPYTVWGDLNGDGVDDALVPFVVAGSQGGGSLLEMYYAVFISQDQQLTYSYSYYRGNHWGLDVPVVTFTRIENGIIYGNEDYYENQYFENYPDWIYRFKNGRIEEEFAPLHPVLNREFDQEMVEYLTPIGLIGDGRFVASDTNLKELKQFFGKKLNVKKVTSEVCDGYFALPYSEDYNGPIRNAELPNATFEINDQDSVTLKQIRFNLPGIRAENTTLCTLQGYITDETTLDDFKRAFPKSYAQRSIIDGEIYIIMAMQDDEFTGEMHWEVIFDKNGKIKRVQYWGDC